MKALIVGSQGFIGTHLRQLITSTYDVAEWGETDLRSAPEVRAIVAHHRPDVVFHLAGVFRSDSERALYDVNVVGTMNLLDAIVAEGLSPRLIVTSSSAVYGSSAGPSALDEDTPLRPLTHYATSKVMQELLVRQFSASHRLRVVIARLFNVIGPGQPASLAAGAFAEKIARAERTELPRIQVSNLDAVRDFVDVRDVARALLVLSQQGGAGQTYNVATGVGRPVGDCVRGLVAAATSSIDVEIKEHASVVTDVRIQVGNADKIRSALGWSPHVPFEQSLRDLLESWRQRLS